MIASLAMYDWPGQSTHWDAFWSHIRDALRARNMPAPEHLSRDGNLWDHWQNPDLILGQTCGLPYRQRLHKTVALVGTLDHALPGAPPGYYQSVLVAHRDAPGEVADFKVKTLAYNDPLSQSGWAAPHAHGLTFTRTLRTGAHRESARAVADGRADIAAIDAETWRLIERYLPEIAAQLRFVAHTDPTPGLPLITARGRDADAIFAAVQAALTRTDPETLSALHIRGIARIPADAYLAIPTPPLPSGDVPAA